MLFAPKPPKLIHDDQKGSVGTAPASAPTASAQPAIRPAPVGMTTTKTPTAAAMDELANRGDKVVRVPSLNSFFFADLWLTPERITYIRDVNTKFALVPLETEDMEDFRKAMEQD